MNLRRRIILAGLALFGFGGICSILAQESPATAAITSSETRVALTEQAAATDAKGVAALAARLQDTAALVGTQESPVRNLRLVVENRSQTFFTYVSGWVTFYDASGIRCGSGIFNLDALAPGESAETDSPGLRLTCTAVSWRLAANSLVTRIVDIAKPTNQESPTAAAAGAPASSTSPPLPPLKISINGEVLPIQTGNPIEVRVGKETVRIVLSPAVAAP